MFRPSGRPTSRLAPVLFRSPTPPACSWRGGHLHGATHEATTGDVRIVDGAGLVRIGARAGRPVRAGRRHGRPTGAGTGTGQRPRSEEHTSELQSLMRISYAVFC